MPTTASPTLQGALKDGFGEAVVACDKPEPCKVPPLAKNQKLSNMLSAYVAILLTQKSRSPLLRIKSLDKIFYLPRFGYS